MDKKLLHLLCVRLEEEYKVKATVHYDKYMRIYCILVNSKTTDFYFKWAPSGVLDNYKDSYNELSMYLIKSFLNNMLYK